MNFDNHVQQWVAIDNQLKQILEKTRELRDKRNTIEQKIIDHAEANDTTNDVIGISQGKLKISSTRTPEPLTFKYLERTLGEIIKNESQVKMIMDYVKQKRTIKVVQEIKRYSNN